NRTGTITINGTTDGNFTGTIFNGSGGTGPLTLVKNGTSTQILGSANLYTGGTNINRGPLPLGDGPSGHGGSIAGASIVNNATLGYKLFGPSTYAGVISGTGAVKKDGPGALFLTGTNTYGGTTTVAAGDLRGTGTLSASSVVSSAGAVASVWPGTA